MSTWIWVIVAMVAGRMLQLWLTYRQSMAFNAEVKRLRAQGTVSVGLGGNRYRGGRAFVAITVDPVTSRVVDAITLQGWTTFTQARPLSAMRGARVNKLLGDREIPGLTPPQRKAARQAAELYRASPTRAVAESGVTTSS